jgi:DNA-binding NtrC family response regulator
MVVGTEPELREEDFAIRPPVTASQFAVPSGQTLEEVEKNHILSVLEQCGFNQTRAAEQLRIDRVTLHNKLKKYGWSRHAAEATVS